MLICYISFEDGQIHMLFPSIISVVPPTILIALAIYVSFRDWNNRGIRVFLLLLLVLIGYGVVEVIIQNQHNVNEVAHLSRIRTAFWGVVAPLSYHTVIALMKEKKKGWKFVLAYLYVLGMALIVLLFSGYTIFKEYYFSWWGWGAVMNPDSWFFWAFHTYLVSGVSAFIITLFAIRQQTESYRVQKLAHTMLINFIWGSSFTAVPYTILSWFKLPTEIFLTYAGNVAMFLIVFAIEKYRPEKFSASSLLSNLSSLLPTEALMITHERKILCPYKSKISIGGFTHEDLNGAGYEKIFVNTALIDKEMYKIKIEANYSASFETECNTQNGTNTILKINISGLRNEFNDVIVFLVVFNEQNDNANLLKYLQTSYELTNREKEVAALLLNGYSNMQICDRLFISLNTVKTHTRNIYQKTNTTNRNEFKNLCRCFVK